MQRIPPSSTPAFTLVEIVLAIGITGFALVAILGMFPVALKAAELSKRETRATLIAQNLVSDLRSGPFTDTAIYTGESLADSNRRIPIDLSLDATYYAGFDSEGAPLGITNLASSQYSNGIPVADATFLAQIAVSRPPSSTNLAHILAEVTAPAAGPLTNRSLYHFATLIGP